MIDINFNFISMMSDLGDYDVTNEDIEILKWFRKITQAYNPKGILIANLDGDDVFWFGFSVKRLLHENSMLKSFFARSLLDESYFDKFANMNLVKLYPKKKLEKILAKVDDFLEDKSENSGQDDVIFFRFTAMQEHCLFDLVDEEYFDDEDCEDEFVDEDDLEDENYF